MNLMTLSRTQTIFSILGKVFFFVCSIIWVLLKIFVSFLMLILIFIDDDEDNPNILGFYNGTTGKLDSHRKSDGIYNDGMYW